MASRTDPAPSHWLRLNHLTRQPRRWIILDTEAHQARVGDTYRQTFRCAVACFDGQDRRGSKPMRTRWCRTKDPADLWRWVDSCTTAGRRTVVVCHNLGYDLRVARAFRHLPELGWTLGLIRLDSGCAWATWRRGDRTLTMVDSVSWFGCSVEHLGQLVELEKPELPAWDDSDAAWFDRCQSDVAILRAAWHRTMRWLEDQDLGNWKPSGAGQGWSAYRHRFMSHKLLHHGFDDVAAAEREAAWTGRCEAWRWGRLPRGPWTEWDYEAAYAWVALDNELPCRFRGHLGPSSARRAIEHRPGLAALLRVTVDTDVPVAPTRGPDGILWPVGRFDSWLWDVEADALERQGARLEVHEGWLYHAEPVLRDWATWVLTQLDAPADELDPVCQLVVKGWSRSLIGRFGARWAKWEPYGESWGPEVRLAQAYDADAGRRFRLLAVGDATMAEGDSTDAPDSVVSVMSWVMACSRVRLWAAMTQAGLENVAYCDTDGLVVNPEGSHRLEAVGLPGLRPKSKYSRVEVYGPRQLVLDGKLRVAGVPKRAVRTGPQSWTATVWRGLAASLSMGDPEAVVLQPRRYRLRGVDHRREHLPDGSTRPLRCP